MVSQLLEVFRQGVWASLTGGYFYQPQNNAFSNLAQLYTWIILVTLPFCIYMFDATVEVWASYVAATTVFFTVVKFLNWQLHKLFDTKEIIEEIPGAKESCIEEGENLELKTFASVPEEERDGLERNGDSSPSEQTDGPSRENIVEATVHQKSSSQDDFGETMKIDEKNVEEGGTGAMLEDGYQEETLPESKEESPSIHEKSPSIKDETERPSMKSGVSSLSSFLPTTERRFSNVSNLARSLVSSSGGSAAFQGLHAAGSLELGYILEESPLRRPKGRKQTVRRTQSAVVTSPGMGSYEPPPSHIVSLDPIGRSDFLRPSNVRHQTSSIINTISEKAEGGSCVEKSSEKEIREENSNGRKSMERTRKSPSTSSKSLDKPLQVTFASDFTVVPINIDIESNGCDTNVPSTSGKNKDHEGPDKLKMGEPPPVEITVREEGHGDDHESKRWSMSSFMGLSRLFRQGDSSEDLSFSYQAIPTANSTEQSNEVWHSLSEDSELDEDPKSPLLIAPQAEFRPNSEHGGCRSELEKLIIDILSRDSIEGCEKELEKLRDTLNKSQIICLKSRSNESDVAGPSSTGDSSSNLYPWSPTRSNAKVPQSQEDYSVILRSRTPTPRPFRSRPRHISDQGESSTHEESPENSSQSALPWNVYNIESKSGSDQLTQIGPLPLPPLGRPWVVGNLNDGTTVSQIFSNLRSERTFTSPGNSSLSFGSASVLLTDNPSVRFVRNRIRTYGPRSRGRDHLAPANDGILPSASPDYFHPLTLHAMLNSLPAAIASHEEHDKIEEVTVPKVKRYYKLKMLKRYLKIRYDRLQLLSLLDRNWSVIELLVSVLLAVITAILGAILLSRNLCHDFTAFLLCVVIGGCQYSLFKSVQPDAASPTHGFNRLVAFSRPTFFCLFSGLVILFDIYLQKNPAMSKFLVYGIDTSNVKLWMNIRDFVLLLILLFPIIFTLGVLPQISTFLVYILEQIDIHLFGGSAVTGLLSSIYAILRSILLVAFLYSFAYVGLIQPERTQHVLFSIFCGILVSTCYHFSRYSSDPSVLINLTRKTKEAVHSSDFVDPLPAKLRTTVLKRLKSDIIICILIGIFVFAVHVSTVFTVLQRPLTDILWSISVVLGFVLHYLIPQARKKLPWSCFAHPFLRPNEYERFEVFEMAKLMWFERFYAWIGFFEKNIVYVVLFLCAFTRDSNTIIEKYGVHIGTLIVVVCAVKCVRSTLCNPSHSYIVVLFAVMLFKYDLAERSETFLVDYCVLLSVYQKVSEMLLKIQFVTTYVAPWQISWGSAFHAFAQPISVPHSAMLLAQAVVSSIVSSPLSPFLGSAIFLTSYPRPIKFWERDYNTKRIDSSNTKLVSQLERNLGSDDNNLNGIFYEQLTRSLQDTLAGDLLLGRWGTVSQGDCFILTSDNMNCLVHIIEIANGLVTFQLRGMEFRGTYCQQREIEAITEDVEDDQGCCCCEPGHLPHMLSGNAAFSQRWLAWQVTATKYVVEGYTVSDNNAAGMLQVYDLRKLLISSYVKSVIFFAMTSPKLKEWLENPTVTEALLPLSNKHYTDVDPTFSKHFDEDYDYQCRGISRGSFCRSYLEWIRYCGQRREKKMEIRRDSIVVAFCLALSLLARRCLCNASPKALSSIDFFLHCLHSLFKGDFRVTCPRDEWVFADMDILKEVIAPAIKMSLKLHQDHFMSPDDYDDHQCLFDAIESHQKNWFISHEGDPGWRSAVLSGVSSLLALRYSFLFLLFLSFYFFSFFCIANSSLE
ncbi:hypothetical protein QYM36_014846 [Artemia franciscana]|uniref:Pecanex-like protein n=1 Tax=Artemia franciscana TaxID=6661 RepID=A0AA88KYN8_ARTSF|nr:hypothetical protein QYM36_014846 [Artemia franciscana]